MCFENNATLLRYKVLHHIRSLNQDWLRPGIMQLICQKSWEDSSGIGLPDLANKNIELPVKCECH